MYRVERKVDTGVVLLSPMRQALMDGVRAESARTSPQPNARKRGAARSTTRSVMGRNAATGGRSSFHMATAAPAIRSSAAPLYSNSVGWVAMNPTLSENARKK
jgi:hypothetical protein